MLSDGCWRRLQHVLRKVNKNLVELATTKQVKVLNNLEEKTNLNTVHCVLNYDPELSVINTNLELFEQI